MARIERLLDLVQALRRRRMPVTAATLAEELGISPRTLYRDIATLRGQGARIDGEPGLGYILRPGFFLPPLMLDGEEIEALLLGGRWVAQRTDSKLAEAAQSALTKISAVLPPEMREVMAHSGLLVPSPPPILSELVDLSVIRRAIRLERKLRICYEDANHEQTERTIWPIAVGFFDQARVIAA